MSARLVSAWILMSISMPSAALAAGQEITTLLDCTGADPDMEFEECNGVSDPFSYGYCIAVHSDGTAFVTGTFSNTVYRVDGATGEKTLILSDDHPSVAVGWPYAVYVRDVWGLPYVYVTGYTSNNVILIGPSGLAVEIVGKHTAGQNSLMNPTDLDFDSDWNLYVTGSVSNTVVKVPGADGSDATVVLDCWGDGEPGVGACDDFMNAQGVAVDAAGNLYASGMNSGNVFKVSPTGDIEEIAQLDTPLDVYVGQDGNVYVTSNDGILVIEPDGTMNLRGVGAGVPIGSHIAVDTEGNLYSGSPGCDCIVKSTLRDGVFEHVATLVDFNGDGETPFAYPIGIVLDDQGRLYSAQEGRGIGSPNPPHTIPASAIRIDLDPDDDGVSFEEDNCTAVANPSQCDSNADGFGNHCDPDLDNDLLVEGVTTSDDDMALFLQSFGQQVPPGNADADLNCDGVVGAPDLSGHFVPLIRTEPIPPGPSGLDCAGSTPCP